jgi:hypothetical protein
LGGIRPAFSETSERKRSSADSLLRNARKAGNQTI